MRKLVFGGMALCMSVLMISCGTSKNTNKAFALEGKWNITAVEGQEVKGMEKAPFLEFSSAEKRVHGNAGCNIINGNFMQEKGKKTSLKFSQMLSTMMACPDLDTERKILDAIEKVSTYKVKAGTASLLDENGNEVLTLEK